MGSTGDLFTGVAADSRHAAFAELARSGPIHHMVLPTTVPAWVVTGYAEARAALNDPRLVKGGPDNAPYVAELEPETSAGLNNHMLTADPPVHTRMRKLVALAFTRRRIEKLEPAVEAVCSALLDDVAAQLASGGTADVVASFAYPLPMTVICDLLGIPAEARADVRQWMAPILMGGVTGFDAYAGAARRLLAYIRSLLAEKRRSPADDLLSALVAARDGDDKLTEDELTSMVQLLFIAGHDTTVSLLSNGLLALLRNPAEYAALRADPDGWPRAVEELLRYDSPTQVAIPLTAAEPLRIAGKRIQRGEVVVVSLLAANRDAARFDSPSSLRLSRDASGHLAFGHGIHHCLGAPLARMEGRIALSAFASRFPEARLAAPVESLTRLPTLIFNKLDSLPVRLG